MYRMNLSKSFNARRKSSRAARKRSRIVLAQAICDLVFQTLFVTLPTQMFVSSARNQVMTCSIVMPCHHFDQMLPLLMIRLICSARIAIPTDTAQLIVHTRWMFSNVCLFFRLSPFQHITVTLLTPTPCRRITFPLSLVLHLDFILTRSL